MQARAADSAASRPFALITLIHFLPTFRVPLFRAWDISVPSMMFALRVSDGSPGRLILMPIIGKKPACVFVAGDKELSRSGCSGIFTTCIFPLALQLFSYQDLINSERPELFA